MTNFEKFKTAKEREDAFTEFCNQTHCYECEICNGISERHYPHCLFLWLDREAEDEKPLPCPFCGGEMNVFASTCCIHCNCGYYPSYFDGVNLQKVIAAHNRVAKAVKESEAKKRKEDAQ